MKLEGQPAAKNNRTDLSILSGRPASGQECI